VSAITREAGRRAHIGVRGTISLPGPMNRRYFLGIWALMVVGIVFVFSASYPIAGAPGVDGMPGNPYWYLWQHIRFVGIALVLMLAVSYVPPQVVRRFSYWLFGVAFALVLLTLLSPWGVERNHAHRWLDLPGLPEFQPSELLKVALIILFATLLARRDEEGENPIVAYAAINATTIVTSLVLLKQPDLGMAMMFVTITLAMLLFGGMPGRWLSLLSLTYLGGGILAAASASYRWRRVTAFIDVLSNPENANGNEHYHILNMIIAQARGGLTGMGLGMNPDKWRWLPAPHTDSIFSVIASEFGLIGALALLVGIFLLTLKALHIAGSSRSAFGFYLASGVAAMLALQSLAHIAVNTSMMPCTGLTLPFISSGGTSLMCASIAAGLVLSVSRYESEGEP